MERKRCLTPTCDNLERVGGYCQNCNSKAYLEKSQKFSEELRKEEMLKEMKPKYIEINSKLAEFLMSKNIDIYFKTSTMENRSNKKTEIIIHDTDTIYYTIDCMAFTDLTKEYHGEIKPIGSKIIPPTEKIEPLYDTKLILELTQAIAKIYENCGDDKTMANLYVMSVYKSIGMVQVVDNG